jgi:hypothetical protein
VVPRWIFSTEVDGQLASYSVGGSFAEQDEFHGQTSGDVTVGGVASPLQELPRTRLSLAGLEFECALSDVGGWRLSNEPARHDPPSACARAPVWHPFHCFSFPDAALATTPELGLGARLRAEVLEVGSGRPPVSACGGELDIRLAYTPGLELAWARFRRDGAEGLLVMSSPGVGMPLSVGSTIDIDYVRNAQDERLLVRDDAGQLLLWMVEALSLDDVVAPSELTLAMGPEQCAMVPSGCTLASQLGIDFTLDGTTQRLAYGERRESGGFVFVHGGYELGLVSFDGCYDGAAAGVTAEVWAVPRAR